jgi:gamma-glutamylcyclotransferase (GGCT)/AIG2-like uncharacterized protein YtfP
VRVFVYGSLLYSEIREAIVPNARVVGRAECPGVELAFRLNLPTLRASATEHVKGVILEVDDRELAYLDRYEGVGHGLYTRWRIMVVNEADEMEEVETYLMSPAYPWNPDPDPQFMAYITRGRQELGLEVAS